MSSSITTQPTQSWVDIHVSPFFLTCHALLAARHPCLPGSVIYLNFPESRPARGVSFLPAAISNRPGPERIETGWWHGPLTSRDYYRVETTGGQRFWIFQNFRDRRWYLHGEF